MKKMTLGKWIYTTFWAITGVFLVILLVLFVVFKDSMVEKKNNINGYSIVSKSVPAGEVMPTIEEYQVLVKDFDSDKENATKEVAKLDGNKITLTEGDYVSFDDVKLIYDYKKYFDLNDYHINGNRPGFQNDVVSLSHWYKNKLEDGTYIFYDVDNNELQYHDGDSGRVEFLDKLVLTASPLYEIGDLKQEITEKAQQQQNVMASMAIVFLVVLTGAVVSTTVVSKNNKKGGKK